MTRQAAHRFHRRRYVNLTNVLVANLRLLGLDDLADRVRRTIARRPSKAADDSGADGDGDGTATDGASADGAEPIEVVAEPAEPASEPVTESA